MEAMPPIRQFNPAEQPTAMEECYTSRRFLWLPTKALVIDRWVTEFYVDWDKSTKTNKVPIYREEWRWLRTVNCVMSRVGSGPYKIKEFLREDYE